MTDVFPELQPELAESDYAGAFAEIVARFRRRAMLVLLTDLVEQAVVESLLPALPLITRTHLVVVAAVRDPEVVRWAQMSPPTEEAYRRAAAVEALDERDRTAARLRGLGATVVDAAPACWPGSSATSTSTSRPPARCRRRPAGWVRPARGRSDPPAEEGRLRVPSGAQGRGGHQGHDAGVDRPPAQLQVGPLRRPRALVNSERARRRRRPWGGRGRGARTTRRPGRRSTPPRIMATMTATSRPPLPSAAIRRGDRHRRPRRPRRCSTDPTAKRGARPRCMRNGVTIGPQAPIRPLVMPPAAATTSTPLSLNGGILSGSWVEVLELLGVGLRSHGAAEAQEDAEADEDEQHRRGSAGCVAPSTLESTVTPTTAPRQPGMASFSTRRWSMLRNRQWEMAGGDAGGDLGEVDRGRDRRGREAGAEQDARARGAEPHAERAVDERRREPGHQHEKQIHKVENLTTEAGDCTFCGTAFHKLCRGTLVANGVRARLYSPPLRPPARPRAGEAPGQDARVSGVGGAGSSPSAPVSPARRRPPAPHHDVADERDPHRGADGDPQRRRAARCR